MAEQLGEQSRKPTIYRVFVSPPDTAAWTPTKHTVPARTRDEANTKATRALEDDPEYRDKVTSKDGYGVWCLRDGAYKPFIAVAEVKVTKRAFK
jgi:hypothetical protein